MKKLHLDNYRNIKYNNFKKLDNFKLDNKIYIQGHTWTIYAINDGLKKLYHCINEKGFKGSFDALQLRQGRRVYE